jgi:hypothetical protein
VKGKSLGYLVRCGYTTNEKAAASVEALRKKAPWLLIDAPARIGPRNSE